MDDGRGHSVGCHDGLVLVAVAKELLGNAPEGVLGLNDILGVSDVRNGNGFSLVGTTREPRQRYSTRQAVQVDSVVDTRRTRDLGVPEIERQVMVGNRFLVFRSIVSFFAELSTIFTLGNTSCHR